MLRSSWADVVIFHNGKGWVGKCARSWGHVNRKLWYWQRNVGRHILIYGITCGVGNWDKVSEVGGMLQLLASLVYGL